MSLRFSSALGTALDEVAQQLVDALNEHGQSCQFDRAQDDAARLAEILAGRVDLVWMCGRLASQLLADGRLSGRIVAAPVLEGESTPVYRSLFVVRKDEARSLEQLARDGVWALNEPESWSGYQAVRVHLDEQQLPDLDPRRCVWTGAHLASMSALRAGAADLAAIDSNVWRAAKGADELRVIGATRDWPAPPLIARGQPAQVAISELFATRAPVGWVPVDEDHCRPIVDAAHSLSHDP